MISTIKALAAAAAAIVATLALCIVIYSVKLRPDNIDEGKTIERTAALQKSMDLIKERGINNEEIRNLDDGSLCRELGGVLVNGQCQ